MCRAVLADVGTLLIFCVVFLAVGSLAMAHALRRAVHSNVLVHGAYGVKGNGLTAGKISLATFAPGAYFMRNVVIGAGDGATYPGGNFFASSLASVGFADLTARNYRLSASRYRDLGADGRDVGADIDRVELETRQAVVAP